MPILKNNSMRKEKSTKAPGAVEETDRLKIPVTIYQGAKNPEVYKIISLDALFKRICNRDEKGKVIADKLKYCYENDKTKYLQIKEGLFGFSVGKFSRRTDRDIMAYVPLLVFDIDGLKTEEDTLLLLAKCKNWPYVFAAFPSVSGHGLRVLIWCESKLETHKEYYAVVCKMLADFLDIQTDKELRVILRKQGMSQKELKTTLKHTPHVDTGTSNVSRFWFFSHVPEADFYLNLESEVFSLPQKANAEMLPVSKSGRESSGIVSVTEKISLCKEMLAKRSIPAGRNNEVFALAKILYEHGVDENDIVKECLNYEEKDFDKKEILKTVKSALKGTMFRKFTDKQLLKYRENGLKVNGEKGGADAVVTSNNKEGKPKRKNKFQQIKAHLMRKYDFRMNEISIELEFKRKEEKSYSELNENNLIVEFLEAGYSSVESMLIALLRSDFVPRYNPFEGYFKSLPNWDEGQPDYIQKLAGFVKAKDPEWFGAQFKKMLVRSVACGLNIIPFNKHCFTLIGKQNDGKTSFLRFLCPPTLGNYIQENLDIHNKDGRIALCQNLFINLDELANFSKYDINRTKAFFTIGRVKERLPYDRKASNHLRRASFLASTNSDEFLTDETGNVRWLVFEIDGIQHDNGGENGYNRQVDIDLVYSQVYALLQSGFDFKLSPEEIAKSEKNNKSYQIITVEQELIQSFFEPASPEAGEKESGDVQFLTSTDILRKLESKTNSRMSLKNIGRALKLLGYRQSQKRVKEINGVVLSHPQPRKGYFVKCFGQ